MDEALWLAGDNLWLMLEHVRQHGKAARTKAGKRRLKLFSCACIRRGWHLLDAEGCSLLQEAERAADGLLDAAETIRFRRRTQERMSSSFRHQPGRNSSIHSALWSAVFPNFPAQMALNAANSMAVALTQPEGALNPGEHLLVVQRMQEEHQRQAELMRDVFGNPFRPLPKRRFPAEVRSLAQACRDGDPGLYPILADALADLGEEQAADHCRESVHVKGCHVVDWILGRA